MPRVWFTSPVPGSLPLVAARAGTLAMTVLLAGWLVVSPAQAATTRTTTGSCVDGGGVTWHTKVAWGDTYTASGVRKVAVDRASWSSTLAVVATDSSVRTYDGAGRLLKSLNRTQTVDYRQGTVSASRDPVNPPSGNARIVVRVGRDADGHASCSVTHRQSTTAAPVVAAVGDLVCEPGSTVTAATCQHKAVSDSVLAAEPNRFLALGDNVYQEGTRAQFEQAYHPSYGRLKNITSPIPGNHEYRTPAAAGYFGYFGYSAGLPSKGYYSHDIGAWHVVALNTERDVAATGEQLAWLKRDLAAHPNRCTMAIMHKPRFSSGGHGSDTTMRPFFDALVAAKAELVLSGHDHDYERFRPQTGGGVLSSAGLTQVVVGTGGKSLRATTTVSTNSVVRSHSGHGWLQLTLHPTSADLRYVAVGGNPFADRATVGCR